MLRNGLLQGGDSGTFGHQGRGLSATVSFSSSQPPSNPLPASRLNGSAAATAPAAASSNGAQLTADSVEELQVIGGLSLSRKAQEMDNLSVLCALRQSCVMLTPETSLTEALEVKLAPCTVYMLAAGQIACQNEFPASCYKAELQF